MSILVIGGAGFIGRRMVPVLVGAGHDVTCVDIDVAGATAAFARLGAHDYRRAYGMTITCVRPANVTGPDKKFGSIDHVNCMCQPARGQSITFPHADAMRCVIHVEDMAEAFARVLLADKPKHTTYNSGGTTLSMGELAALVRELLPKADIRFNAQTGGRAISGNFLIDNRRLIEEFGLQYGPLRQRVKEVINDIRAGEGLPPVA